MSKRVGPWGGSGGSPWDDGAYQGIRQIIVVHALGIDSIRIEYDRDGSSVWSERHGGTGGTRTDKIELDYRKESLTSVSGHYGPIAHGSGSIIRSLTFDSNLKKYGPYGPQQGTYFSFSMTGEKVVGFHGQSGWYLDCIGLYLHPDLSIVPATISPKLTPSQSKVSFDGNSNKTYNILLALGESADKVNVRCSRLNSLAPTSFNSVSPSFSTRGSEDGDSTKLSRIYGSQKSSIMRSPVVYGPCGGNGGSIFDDGIYTGVRQIVLSRGVGISSIKVEYDRNGLSMWGNRHGGSTGAFKTDRIVFDYPFEILTSITGYFGSILFRGPTVIKSLTFQTTRRNYGPYGEEHGTFFSSKSAEGMITGFHGRKGWYLDAIGVHVLEGQIPQGGRPFLTNEVGNGSFSSQDGEGENIQWTNKSVSFGGAPLEEVAYGVVREPVPLGPGPWGGEGGKPWDDGVFSGIKQIIIMRGEVIHSIQVEYDRNGQSVWSMRHGGSGGETTNRIKLDYPNEVVTCVSGYHCRCRQDGSDPSVIRSLSFYSSRGKYGPFGEELGTFFTSAQTGGKIVGFHGKSGVFLDAIGVHMQHWLGNEQKPSRSRITKFLSGS
jgi:hypothetical protein